MMNYIANGGSLVLVSHFPYLIQASCERGMCVDKGQIVHIGTSVEAIDAYFRVQQSAENARRSAGADGESREARDVTIESLELEAADGGEVITGGPARITLRYRSARELQGVFWGFLVYTNDLWMCITGGATGMSGEHCRTVAGEGTFRCTIPRLPLVAGTYALRAVIGDAETKVPYARWGWENAPTFFGVASPTSEVKNLHAMCGNVVDIDVKWESDG
jgi:hypothetical protein